MNGIAWSIVERMLVDAPGYEDENDNQSGELELTADNADSILNYVNNMLNKTT